ncbi:MAG: dihydrofolate reductase [bacterium]
MMTKPELVIVAALAERNRVIGKEGKLPWHISEDLKRFKRLTSGHTVLMGRNTFESILQRNGKPLPQRQNVVLTRTKTYPTYPEVLTFASLEDALEGLADQRTVFVIGGEQVFEKTLFLASRLELTIIEDEYQGDAFFPEYHYLIGGRFKRIANEDRDGYRFESYVLMK